jgi:surface antigen
MAGPAARHLSRRPSYNGTARTSLCLGPVLALVLACGGCAVPNPFGSLLTKRSSEQATAYATEDVSGALAAPRSASASTVSGLPPDADLEYVRIAIVDMLGRGSKDISIPWENPGRGAHGTVTPIASAYRRDGVTCRDFLASHVQRGTEAWLHGEACQTAKGRWEVRSLRPWLRS